MFALWQRALFMLRRADAVGRVFGKFRSSLTGKCGRGCSNRAEGCRHGCGWYALRFADHIDCSAGITWVPLSYAAFLQLLTWTNLSTRHRSSPTSPGDRTGQASRQHNTRGSPLSVWRSSLPHPYIRWTQERIQTMMQIYASAARLRSSGCPISRHDSHAQARATATSDRSWQIVALKRRFAKT